MLIIQTNDGLSTANSYVSETELSNYTTARGIVLSRDLNQLLFLAMDYIESKQYKSDPLNTAQSTLFPRLGVAVPRNIKQAQLLLAILADSTDLMAVKTDVQVKAEQVDVVKVEYFEGANAVTGSPLMQKVNDLLKPYLSGGLGLNVSVYRG